MRTDLHLYATVPMPDAGAGAPAPEDRRCSNDEVVATYENLCRWARTADDIGYDTPWLTEHHFQHEGYEVTPNLILFGLHLAGITRNLRQGQAFNVVPQWHPLRLAEDFASADVLTGGRMVFGVGRGTVPRESQTLGAPVASGDNAMSAELDRLNRERFEDMLQAVVLAANRDPAVFADPHRFDAGRAPNPHVAFGGGAHTCLGAHVVRLEARVVLERMRRRWRRIEVEPGGAALHRRCSCAPTGG